MVTRGNLILIHDRIAVIQSLIVTANYLSQKDMHILSAESLLNIDINIPFHALSQLL